jgi:predicted nucleic acid-binding protein
MKLILDANVLLNGIFNPLSLSSKLLNLSHSGSIQCCVIEHNIAEAHDIMSRVQANTGVSLHDLFDASVNKLSLSFLEPVDENELGRFTIVGGIKDAPLAA